MCGIISEKESCITRFLNTSVRSFSTKLQHEDSARRFSTKLQHEDSARRFSTKEQCCWRFEKARVYEQRPQCAYQISLFMRRRHNKSCILVCGLDAQTGTEAALKRLASARDWTGDLLFTRQMLCHWATQAQLPLFTQLHTTLFNTTQTSYITFMHHHQNMSYTHVYDNASKDTHMYTTTRQKRHTHHTYSTQLHIHNQPLL